MFKVGDRARIKNWQNTLHGFEVGDTVKITGLLGGDRPLVVENDRGNRGYASEADLEIINGKRGRPRTKPAPVNFLLKYDLDEDPVEEFETMAQVKDRIKQLSERSDLKRDSIVIYEVKKKRTVTIETKINIK